jgi:hypothetical protein
MTCSISGVAGSVGSGLFDYFSGRSKLGPGLGHYKSRQSPSVQLSTSWPLAGLTPTAGKVVFKSGSKIKLVSRLRCQWLVLLPLEIDAPLCPRLLPL